MRGAHTNKRREMRRIGEGRNKWRVHEVERGRTYSNVEGDEMGTEEDERGQEEDNSEGLW